MRELCRINSPRPEPITGELQARLGVPPGVDRVHLGAGFRGDGNVGEQCRLINVFIVRVPRVCHDRWRPDITRDRLEVLPNGGPAVAGERSDDDLAAVRASTTAHGKLEAQVMMITVFAHRHLPAATPANGEPVAACCAAIRDQKERKNTPRGATGRRTEFHRSGVRPRRGNRRLCRFG